VLQRNLTHQHEPNKAGRAPAGQTMALKRKLGLSAVLAVVVGDIYAGRTRCRCDQ
jgi:hypothetical protein